MADAPVEQTAPDIEAAAAPEGQSSNAWEMVTQEYLNSAFQTERLKVPGGWLYRSRCLYDTKQSGIALCWVPQLGSGEQS